MRIIIIKSTLFNEGEHVTEKNWKTSGPQIFYAIQNKNND